MVLGLKSEIALDHDDDFAVFKYAVLTESVDVSLDKGKLFFRLLINVWSVGEYIKQYTRALAYARQQGSNIQRRVCWQ